MRGLLPGVMPVLSERRLVEVVVPEWELSEEETHGETDEESE